MTLAEDLARMEAEDKAATPGPWSRGWEHETMAEIVGPNGVRLGSMKRGSFLGGSIAKEAEANHALVCAARTGRPALVEMVRLLIDRLSDATSTDLSFGIDPDGPEIEALWAEAKWKAGAR